MAINSKTTLNKPDYRPDLLPQSYAIRNIFFLIAIAFAVVVFVYVIKLYKKTETNETTAQIFPQSAKKNISNSNIVFKCTNANGAVIYQNTCPSNSKSEAIEIYKISGVQAYKPITNNNSYREKSSSAAIFDREKETCKKRVQEKINNLKRNRSYSKSERTLLEKYEQELRNCLL